jgi:hypothetical protein
MISIISIIFVSFVGAHVSIESNSIEVDVDGSLIVYPGTPCIPNTYFNNESGAKCICDFNGSQVCETRKEQLRRIYCKPNSIFNDGCNTCYCMPDRSDSWCTQKICYGTARYCERGKSYQIGCRVCSCDRKGTLVCKYTCI